MNTTSRDAALTTILINTGLRVEDGDRILSFQPIGHDAADFTSIHRSTLKKMLDEAYEAGRASAAKA